MAVEIRMPKMGLTMTTATVGAWLKKEGDLVAAGEALVEVMTDKITNTLEAATNGVLLRIVCPEGAEVEAMTVLGVVGQPGEQVGSVPAQSTSAQSAQSTKQAPAVATAQKTAAAARPAGGRIFITPLARKIARDNNVDYSAVQGTGPGGRILRKDIEKAMAVVPCATQAQPCGAGAPAQANVFQRIPYKGMRKAIGQNMLRSWHEAPQVTLNSSVDVSALLALRTQLNEGREKIDKLTLTDLLIKLTAAALERHPNLNATFDGTEVVQYSQVNMSVAIAVDAGLVVPVVRGANEKSLSRISAIMQDLVGRARRLELAVDESVGGTFTLTNLGGYKSVDTFSPIINSPQVAILGIGRTVETPIAINGEVVIRPMMGLSLSHDHRVVDGAPAAAFLATLLELFQKPLQALV